jgi:RNA polymerase sigma-70 factor (sigma-E family)
MTHFRRPVRRPLGEEAVLQLAGTPSQIPRTRTEHDADRAVSALYTRHYRSLVRLAALLVEDTAVAEEIVQDSFVAVHRAWRKLMDSDRAVPYLHRSVVNRSRWALRHRATAEGLTPNLPPSTPATQQDVTTQLEPAALTAALRALPGRQREAVVLRYYADLPEPQIAAALGITTTAVSKHITQAMSSLRAVLPGATTPPNDL